MTIKELYEFLGEFIKKYPKCVNQRIMVKRLDDDFLWEEVTIVETPVANPDGQFGSPIYFHSKSQEEALKKYIEENKNIEDDDDEYYY